MKKMSTKYLIRVSISVILLILLDQLTKIWAVVRLKDQPAISLIRGVFELQYLENRGSAFGMMQSLFYHQYDRFIPSRMRHIRQDPKRKNVSAAARDRGIVSCRRGREFHRPCATGLCRGFLLFFTDQFPDI